MKKTLVTILGVMSVSTAVFAQDNSTADFQFPQGLFISGQINNSWAHDNTLSLNNIQSSGVNASIALKNDMGIGGGAGLGYAFNRFFAVEAGYRHFEDLTAVAKTTNLTPQLEATDDASMNVADLLARVTIPMDRFFIYAKGGAAYAMLKNRNDLTVTAGGAQFTFDGVLPAESVDVWRPEAALGVGYALTSHVTAEASYGRIFGLGKLLDAKYVPDVDSLGLGLSYYF